MNDPYEDEYGNWMHNIQLELEAFEGEGPPSDEALLRLAHDETGGMMGLVEMLEEEYEFEYDEMQTLKGDVLKMRVALEMALGYRK